MRAWLTWMGVVTCLGVAACDNKSDGSSNDADGDGVPAAEDCDDADPTLGAREDDGDCDGVPWADDCDDASPASAVRADDGDCDGIPTSADCDDTNDQVPTFDQDCDGTETELDCDDSDASVPADDADCDGVATADDCDDANALLGDRASDADCDGATTAIDCDDADPGVGDITQDADCDGVRTSEDCADGDPTMPVGDEDCDGVGTADDCDDTDAALGLRSEDGDCDGVANEHDCAPDDDEVAIDRRSDNDCDGLPSSEDCDDDNAERPYIDDPDCDDIATHPAGGDMVRITAGTFEMGMRSTDDCEVNDSEAYYMVNYALRETNADDQHTVTLTRDFYLGVTELTNDESYTLFGSGYTGNTPAEVSRNSAIRTLNIMSVRFGFTECYAQDATTGVYEPVGDIYECDGYRLPTEAEWEYAARCTEPYEWAGSDDPDEVSYYPGWEYPQPGAQEVGLLAPNACGLYDMSGNVHEAIHDWYDADAYATHAAVDPVGPETGVEDRELTLIRGGSFSTTGFETDACQTAVHRRNAIWTTTSGHYLGFRVARTIKY